MDPLRLDMPVEKISENLGKSGGHAEYIAAAQGFLRFKLNEINLKQQIQGQREMLTLQGQQLQEQRGAATAQTRFYWLSLSLTALIPASGWHMALFR